MEMQESETRQRLGIPVEAERVLVFGESSHWDPNWLYTSDEYYRRKIQPIMLRVISELEKNPRRVFSIESLFFLVQFFEQESSQREKLRELIHSGQLRLIGTGMTTPDTNLPDPESILRDYLLGQEWLRRNGIEAEPDLAYLPDDFGSSPGVPAMLSALGFDKTVITRIDGMHFVGCDYRTEKSFPQRGSSAQLLLKELQTLDFVWRAPDGAEVLCHWNAFTYFQGDMLGSRGVIRWMDKLFGVPWRTERHVAAQIAALIKQLAPLAKTPYMSCPIGCDFNGPMPQLIELLDRYNRKRYPDTGVWVVNAAADDYLRLVDFHRECLPTVDLDPNPFWMGHYASRPGLKQRCRELTDKLQLAEKLVLADGRQQSADPRLQDLESAWNLAVLSNHHDFITGTSPDRTVIEEQEPWLAEGLALVDGVLSQCQAVAAVEKKPAPAAPPSLRRQDGKWLVTTSHYQLVLDERLGGCIVSLQDASGSTEYLRGPANDMIAYGDTGGLWRLGHEYCGGHFRERDRCSLNQAEIQATERGNVLELRVDCRLDFQPTTRWLWFRADSPVIRMRTRGAASRRQTVTCSFPIKLSVGKLHMDVPGALITRPAHKLTRPTFWCAQSFVQLQDRRRDRECLLLLGRPASVSARAHGALEWMVLRYAPWERAFGFLPVPAHPAAGHDDQEHDFDYAVRFAALGDGAPGDFAGQARQVMSPAWLDSSAPDLEGATASLVQSNRADVRVTAVKPAHRGPGIIVRLSSSAPKGTQVSLRCPSRSVQKAYRCDARERDLEQLEVEQGTVSLAVSSRISSIRLID